MGITNLDSLTLADDLIVGGTQTITGATALTGAVTGTSATLTGELIADSVRLAASGGVAIKSTTATVTAAQTRALAATQIELVAAPGAGVYNIFLGALLELDFGTIAHDDAAADGNLVIRYTDGSGAICAAVEADTFIDAAADAVRWTWPCDDVAGAANIPITPVANAAIVLDNDGAEYTGTGDSVIDVTVYYIEVTSQL